MEGGVFPSRNARASLKRILPILPPRLLRRLPEQKCSGLIEASSAASFASRSASHGLPEQKCSGLIEAVPVSTSPSHSTTVFPSRNARASLKLEPVNDVLPHRVRPVFPSRNARASLKHGLLVSGELAEQVFPSRNARASLKQLKNADLVVILNQRLPEQKCSGLIEARSTRCRSRSAARASSRAEMLGPH